MSASSEHITTAQLLELIANDNERAFTVLYNRHFSEVYRYAKRILKQDPIAEEISQDVFTQVWLHKHSLSVIVKFEAFLHIVSRNLCYDKLDKLAQEQRLNKEFALLHNTSAEEPLPEHEDSLRRLLASLPHRRRLVYSMHLQGFKRAEIADALNISVNTVKSHLAAAAGSARDFFIKLSEVLWPLFCVFHSY